ncbi:hypothetical protein Droror1_Dr00023231 [Drosera rotundifolia]
MSRGGGDWWRKSTAMPSIKAGQGEQCRHGWGGDARLGWTAVSSDGGEANRTGRHWVASAGGGVSLKEIKGLGFYLMLCLDWRNGGRNWVLPYAMFELGLVIDPLSI